MEYIEWFDYLLFIIIDRWLAGGDLAHFGACGAPTAWFWRFMHTVQDLNSYQLEYVFASPRQK